MTKTINLHSIESKLAGFICNGCKVSTTNDNEAYSTLYDWLYDHDYIPFGRFIIKNGENIDLFAKAMEEFDNTNTPLKKVLLHCLRDNSDKIDTMPIVRGFRKGNILELR